MLAVALASFLIVVVASAESPRGCFSPGWLNIVTWIFLPLGLLATFAAACEYGLRQGWSLLGTFIAAVASTALLGVIVVYVILELTLDPGCFS
jgi:predicted permease